MYVETDSPGLRTRVLNLNLCTASDGVGLKWFVNFATNSLYELSPGLAGASRLCNSLYVVGPITARNTDRFFSAESMSFAAKKCPVLVAKYVMSQRPLK